MDVQHNFLMVVKLGYDFCAEKGFDEENICLGSSQTQGFLVHFLQCSWKMSKAKTTIGLKRNGNFRITKSRI